MCLTRCVSKLANHWFRWWPVACLAPSHYLNQRWNKFNWSLGNYFTEILNQSTLISFSKNHWKMSSAKWQRFSLYLNEFMYQQLQCSEHCDICLPPKQLRAPSKYRQISNISAPSKQYNCWSLRCSWSMACRRCSYYIFIIVFHLTSIYCTKTTASRDEKHLSFGIWCVWY